MNIPTWPQADEREAELLRMVLESPHWGGFHPFVAEFEQSFARYQHASYGISAFNGTVTLELALAVLGIGQGDEVIVPEISFISTATAVSRVGALPVFVDIGAESFNIDVERVREAISGRTKAVIPVHFGGTMCDMDALCAVCRAHGLHLIEDAAHAPGAEWKSQRAGSFGVFGSFSFQNGKVLCAGEGGMLTTSDPHLAEIARSIANCGRHPGRSFYDHVRLGTNFRMGAFQAAVLISQFERLPEQISVRMANAARLKEQLAASHAFAWQAQAPEITQNPYYLLLGGILDPDISRDDFCAALAKSGVPVTPFYPHTLSQNELYKSEPSRVLPCPRAEERIKDSFWIAHRVLLSNEDTLSQVAEAMLSAAESARRRTAIA